MIIQPRTRGFICITTHPEGTAKNVHNQIEYVKSKNITTEGPKKVLVIGASTGFGLSSRITAAFGYNAATIGVFFEKPAAPNKPGTAGWYNTAAFEKEALEFSNLDDDYRAFKDLVFSNKDYLLSSDEENKIIGSLTLDTITSKHGILS